MRNAPRFQQLEPRTPGMRMNHGYVPAEAVGKRVVVELRNGRICGREPVTTVTPAGWAADTSRWSLTGEPFDIIGYEVLG